MSLPIKALVFIYTKAGTAFKVVGKVKELEGVREAYTVTGEFDVVAKVEVADLKELGEKVVNKIQGIEGVIRTVTSIIVE